MSQDLSTAHGPRLQSALPDKISGKHERHSYLCSQASGTCVRIDSHCRKIYEVTTAEQLAEMLKVLQGEDLVEGLEEFVIRRGKKIEKRQMRQMMQDAQAENLTPEEKAIRLERVRSAIHSQLVREKLEKVKEIHQELRTVESNTKMSPDEKKLAVQGVLTKALQNGIINEETFNNYLSLLQEEGGISKVINSFDKTLVELQEDLKKTEEALREKVKNPTIEFKVAYVSPNMIGLEPDRRQKSITVLEGQPQAIVFSIMSSIVNTDESPARSAYIKQIVEALEELCEAKRRAAEREKVEDQLEEQRDQKLEIQKLRDILRELKAEVPDIRVSDVQVVLAHLENLSHESLRQLILSIKNMFGGAKDSDRD